MATKAIQSLWNYNTLKKRDRDNKDGPQDNLVDPVAEHQDDVKQARLRACHEGSLMKIGMRCLQHMPWGWVRMSENE